MNHWFRQQEKEAQDRKHRDLEFRFHELERDRDRLRIERDEYKKKFENKCVMFDNLYCKVTETLRDNLSDIENYNF